MTRSTATSRTRRTRRTRTAAAVAGGLAAAVTLASPASADEIGVTDPDDTAHGSDLRSVDITHGRKNITVVTTHTDLRRDPASGSGGTLYLDTDPDDRGPEYAFAGGYFAGTDYVLLDVEGFGRGRQGEPVDGPYEMSIDYDAEQVRFDIPRATVGRPDAVRLAMRTSGTRSDGTSRGLTDWLGEPRSLTPAVERG